MKNLQDIAETAEYIPGTIAGIGIVRLWLVLGTILQGAVETAKVYVVRTVQ